MKRLLLLTLTLIVAMLAQSFAQTSSKRGDDAFDQYRFEEAVEYYSDALTSTNSMEDYALMAYRIGYCYREMRQMQMSEEFLAKALKANSQQLAPEARLYYADALRMNGKYEDAIEVYETYLDIVPDDYRAEVGIESCKNVPKWENEPTRYEVSNMAYFNSMQQDFSPAWGDSKNRTVFYYFP